MGGTGKLRWQAVDSGDKLLLVFLPSSNYYMPLDASVCPKENFVLGEIEGMGIPMFELPRMDGPEWIPAFPRQVQDRPFLT